MELLRFWWTRSRAGFAGVDNLHGSSTGKALDGNCIARLNGFASVWAGNYDEKTCDHEGCCPEGWGASDNGIACVA